MPLIILLTLIVICLLFVLRKVSTENKELKRKLAENTTFLQQLQTKDPLTQVMTRHQFIPLVEEELRRARRNHFSMALIACDLDFFNRYNEINGHIAGDECLYKIAQTLDSSVKRAGECVCRMGGEEFWVLLPNVDERQAIDLANILRKKVQELKITHGDPAIAEYVTMSMGIVSFVPSEEDELKEWMWAAENALNTAKNEGRDRYHIAE